MNEWRKRIPRPRSSDPSSDLFKRALKGQVRAAFITLFVLMLGAAGTIVVVPTTADALFGFFEGRRDNPDQVIPDPVVYSAEIEAPEAPDELKTSLDDASQLTSDDAGPVSGTVGLIAAAGTEQRRLIGALYQEGYYGGTVEVFIEGERFEVVEIDRSFASGVVPVLIQVDPGRQFDFGNVTIKTSDGASVDSASYGIVPGAPAKSTLIVDAANEAVAAEQNAGRPLARVESREIVADHANGTLDVVIIVEPGGDAVFGSVRVEGADRMRQDFIVKYADIPVGQSYSPAVLASARRRLQELGVFDSVIVETAEEISADGSIPVIISVVERKRRVIGAGVTYSNTEGGGVEAYWGHRNLFGGAESIRFEGAFARIGEASNLADYDYSIAVLFAKPGVFGPSTMLTARLFALHENPDAFERDAAGASVTIDKKFTPSVTGRIGTGIEWARTQDTFGDGSSLLLSVTGEAIWDTRDNIVDPTTGFRLSGSLSPNYDTLSGASFVVSRATLSAYQAIGQAKRLVLAGRVAAGSIFGADLEDIPGNSRFFSGGGGSVRGYVFQAIGPRSATNTPTGGRSFAEASFEARFRVTEKIGIVPFIDAGTVSEDLLPGSSEWFSGVGIGLRYATPVGPLRLDVAAPLNKIDGDPDFGLYVGIGQAF